MIIQITGFILATTTLQPPFIQGCVGRYVKEDLIIPHNVSFYDLIKAGHRQPWITTSTGV